MAAYFLDTSALVKRYVQETGTSWVLGACDPAAGHVLCMSRIAQVEFVSAIVRRMRIGTISQANGATALADFRLDVTRQYRNVALTESVLNAAAQLAESHGMRAYDAVQLATAIEIQSLRTGSPTGPLIVVSSDADLNAVARAEGLIVEDPNSYP